ncbi:MAG: efflux RND transporter periplasmic adaptor subunit, partial [Pseudomonadota bacterium]|nr:efflux RND transporter periplasmic adaptor subunit [Pseudomonadota bacterium]
MATQPARAQTALDAPHQGSVEEPEQTHPSDSSQSGNERAAAEPGQEQEGDTWWHRLQDWVIGLLGGVHPHDEEQAGQADHGEPNVVTDFDDQTELFVEFPPLIVGESAEFLVHLTRLADFKPVTEGEVTVVLAGAGAEEETFGSTEPARPGLFRVRVTPGSAGSRRIRILLEAPDLSAAHDLGEFRVFPDEASADAAFLGEESGDDGGVVFLKEQQWRSDFATVPVERRLLRGSVPATGILRATADGEAHVTAPSAGHLTAASGGFPYTGMQVTRGQILAYLAPRLGGEADVAGLELDLQRAESNFQLASQERRRLEGLLEKGAVAERRVFEARGAEAVAGAELEAARKRLAQLTRDPGSEAGGVAVRAPIGGTIAYVNVAPGGYVAQGDRLFHVVDPGRFWLEARLAEVDLGRIRQPAGAWFRAQGFDRAFEVDPARGARVVAFGGMVDPVSRTVPAVFEFQNPDDRLRVGLFVTARVYTGDEQDALAVPAGALVDDGGAQVVYVQLGGERYERRLVQTGLRDGDYVAILEGLEPGERVVSRGAYLVHLAAGTPAEAGHGHAH